MTLLLGRWVRFSIEYGCKQWSFNLLSVKFVKVLIILMSRYVLTETLNWRVSDKQCSDVRNILTTVLEVPNILQLFVSK